MPPENEYREETELDSQPQNDSTNLDQTDESQPELDTNVWTHEREEALEAKLAKDGDVTDEELEGYDKWIEAGKPTPEEVPENEEIKAKESNADSEDAIPSDSSKEEPQSEEEIQSLTDAMKAVGAKTVDELPDKIKGLRSQLGKQGGELGQELKDSQVQLKNMTQLFNDLAEGKPEAIEYMKSVNPNYKGLPTTAEETTAADKKPVPDDILDDKLYEYVQGLEKKIESLEGFNKTSQDKAAGYLATEQTVNEIGEFVQRNPDYFNAAGNLGDLMRTYMGQQNDDPVDPRLTEIHKLMTYASENGLKTLDDAHWLMNKESISQRIIDARKEGRQSMDYKPNPGLSNNRRQGSETTYKQYSDREVEDIVAGRAEIPGDWTDANGEWVVSKIPASARKHITYPGMN